jgi:uncharacterized membrane protein
MNTPPHGRFLFRYLAVLTTVSVALIGLNVLLGMQIPFAVGFLIAYVGALMVFVVWHAYLTKGWWQSLLMLAASFLIAFTAEALGVNAGLIFGPYHYTGALGIQVFGVPLLAALAWEPIVYAAFSITDVLIPPLARRSGTWSDRLPWYVLMSVVGALATTAWDMMIDPIAVSEGWWVWENGGPYVPHVENGVPISNFLGWLGVAFLINFLYRILADTAPPGQRSASLSLHGPLMLYGSLFLTASGVALTVLRRSDVALVGLLTMGPFLAIALANASLAHRDATSPLPGNWPGVEDGRQPIKADHPTP